VEFVFNTKLFCSCKSLQTTDRCANGEFEIKSSKLSSLVHKGMGMFLDSKVLLKTSSTLHDSEKIVVASKEYMKTHFNVVSFFVFPGTDFSTYKGTHFEHFHLMACICKIHSGNHSCKTSADDTNFERFFILLSWSVLSSCHEILIQKGIVSDLTLGSFRSKGSIFHCALLKGCRMNGRSRSHKARASSSKEG
jgi:hypothetical protein